ncbi:Vps52-domain-containing protein [Gonapodya prolifera JEL478]|uniref:Vps52-domain-containing protein n=1 Tax=Gonapodya prolifera (strain JEL478) TaxID=1344416 RepID=A0A139A8F1_GONPJ|nr:Vps52-domain-containing protein [Gonapodya prolifera JEL478]|eukprot:KXS13007.1 Vps52-domain-containing protein [Gonapodya prolifera JEL478]
MFYEDPLIRDAIQKGVDLRQYAKDIEQQLKEVENEHIMDYVTSSRQLTTLHSQISRCSDLLSDLEGLFEGFQSELGGLAEEIRDLKERSERMDVKLKNRSAVERQLSVLLDGVVLSPSLIRKICDGEINDSYMEAVQLLTDKIAYVKGQQGKHVLRAFKEIGPELERLRLKATERLRDYITDKLKALRTTTTNVAIIQQNVLLKNRDMYWFLLERHAEAASEIRSVYVATLQAHYLALFDRYCRAALRLQAPAPSDRSDLMAEEGARRGLSILGLGGAVSKLVVKDKANVFALGDRVQVVLNPDPGIILVTMAEANNARYPFEAIFKSVTRLLLDNASSEYIFTTEYFFSPRSRQGHGSSGTSVAGSIFTEIFEPTLKLVLSLVKQYSESTYDAVGLLLCIRLNQQAQLIMQKRRIPGLESFTNAITMLLWPRFQSLIDMHCESLRKASAAKLIGPTKDFTPHFVTRRYSEFAASILTLNQGYDDALLHNSLSRLRNEIEGLLFRMSAEFGDRRSRLIFLINNYDLVTSILSEYTAPTFESEKLYFGNVLANKMVEYVEEELRPRFSGLIGVVVQCENAIGAGDLTAIDKIDGQKLELIASDFNSIWKTAISEVNQSVLQSFPNLTNGVRVLQAVLTRLIVYYRQFLEIWQRRFTARGTSVSPVGLQVVMLEIKRLARVV